LRNGHMIRSGGCVRTADSIAGAESTTATATSWPRSVNAIQARWLKLLCAETRNRICMSRSGRWLYGAGGGVRNTPW
jgi:hypothetical protein